MRRGSSAIVVRAESAIGNVINERSTLRRVTAAAERDVRCPLARQETVPVGPRSRRQRYADPSKTLPIRARTYISSAVSTKGEPAGT